MHLIYSTLPLGRRQNRDMYTEHLASHFNADAKQVHYTKLCVYIYALCIHGKLSVNDFLVI